MSEQELNELSGLSMDQWLRLSGAGRRRCNEALSWFAGHVRRARGGRYSTAPAV